MNYKGSFKYPLLARHCSCIMQLVMYIIVKSHPPHCFDKLFQLYSAMHNSVSGSQEKVSLLGSNLSFRVRSVNSL